MTNRGNRSIPQWFVTIAFAIMGSMGLGIATYAASNMRELAAKTQALEVRQATIDVVSVRLEKKVDQMTEKLDRVLLERR